MLVDTSNVRKGWRTVANVYVRLLRPLRHLARPRRPDPIDSLVETARRLEYGGGSRPDVEADGTARADSCGDIGPTGNQHP